MWHLWRDDQKRLRNVDLGFFMSFCSMLSWAGIGSGSDTEDDEHVCGKCRAEFPSLAEFLQHKKRCVSKRPVLLAPLDELDDNSDDELDDMDESDDRLTPPLLEKVRKPREWIWGKNLTDIHPLLLLAQRRPDTNVTLEELKNTTVAVAQHGQLLSNHLALREFFSRFHQRHVESLQLIKTIEDIVLKTDGMPAPTVAPPPLIGTAALTPPQSADGGPAVASASVMAAYPQGGRTGSLSPIPPPPPETNNLALLEKQAERYLQDSMSRRSFMLNGIDEDSRVKKSKSDSSDPAHRNRCHFCGKTLGSESALQIHLRSHTGEKPFRCNVCGSSFSTKGNLKVHCQRHRELGGSSDEHRQPEQNDSRTENPPLLFAQDSGTRGETKLEQALDFSSTVNGRRSPMLDSNSRSISPNDMSNFSDNSDESSDENMTAENFRELKIDVERFDDDDHVDSDGMDDDESEMATSQPSFGPSPNFAPYFLPTSCENFVPSTSQSENKNSSNGTINNGGSEAILQDPSFYQDLLPRIGSNDNSWESLIEVTKTSETSKLQQLVDNIEHKLIEPNQCIICHRVLSCKSALQMHYRTHTGERPFKCKLCSRAFTTKGNLKTHMGVHRTKPATRLMHQCPVCHKPFPNSLLLQQHVRNHTENPSIQLPPLYNPNEDRPPTLLPPSYPRQFLLPPQLMNAEPLALTNSKTSEQLRNNSTNESVIKPTGLDNNNGSQVSCASPTLSTASSCSPSSNIAESPKDPKPPVLDLARSPEEQSPKDTDDLPAAESSKETENDLEKSRNSNNSTPVDMKSEYEANIKSVLNHNQSPSNISDHSPLNGQEAEDQSPSSAKFPPKFSSQPNNSIVISLASDRPLPMTLPNDCPLPFTIHGSDRTYPAMSVSTCTSDYTASLAALENHVKGITSNVTQPLPFPPHFGLGLNVSGYYRDFGYPPKPSNISPTASKNGSDVSADDRSTPGGVGTSGKGESPRLPSLPNHSTPKSESSVVGGPLDLTPRNSPAFQRPSPTDTKIYLPLAGLPFASPHSRMGTTCRICFKTFACQSALEIHYRSHTKERPFRCEVCDRGFSTKGNMRQHMLTHKIRDLPSQVFSTSNTNSSSSTVSSSQKEETNGERSPKKSPEESAPIKRPPAESPVPVPQPKRAPGQPKHMCEVCHKPFSSGSALQIHMRTHTGDKPFQCHICQRAFTTKGNLKVHMGTHMWNNSTSRRGRRMSLDLGPLQIPPGAKPGEFPQAPYFPYLSPFMNGLPPPPPQHPPKMNEISVIQTAGISNGPPPTTTSSSSSVPQQPLALLSAACKQREESSLNQNQILSQGKDTRPAMTPPAPEMNVSWPWKISCNICSKICTSSTELEMHIRNNHCKKETSDAPNTATRADSVA
ncbi:sal-like protein 4 [Uloborus diversus]|uniref:sal-like protein 4 n=1 Tax=Uloborus diversus TaxID=327109 RepID=UPI0024098A1C|nr:sal-like protein 4 [Uloborus diversus]